MLHRSNYATDKSPRFFSSREVIVFRRNSLPHVNSVPRSVTCNMYSTCTCTPQVMSVLGFLYTHDSAPAFAVFKFVQVCISRFAHWERQYKLNMHRRTILYTYTTWYYATFCFIFWSGFGLQSLTAAIGFFYSGVLLLHFQLLIMLVTGSVGVLCFFVVEWRAARLRYEPLTPSEFWAEHNALNWWTELDLTYTWYTSAPQTQHTCVPHLLLQLLVRMSL